MLNKEDFNKIEKGSSKLRKTEGIVYGNVGGKVNFHELKKFKVGELSLEELFEKQVKENQELLDKIQILKEGILQSSKELAEMKIILAKYGME